MNQNNWVNKALQIIQQHPKSVAALFNKHGISADVNNRNVANAIKVKPDFFKALTHLFNSHKDSDAENFTGYANLTGDTDRITLADRLANAGVVFSNVIRETQRQPEPYNKVTPGYYEPAGNFNWHSYTPDTRILGMDKKLFIILALAVVAIVFFELHKK